MKKTLCYIAATMFALPLTIGLTNCENPEVKPDEPVTLSLSGNTLQFAWDDERVEKTITATTNASQIDAEAETGADWLDVAVEDKQIIVQTLSKHDPELDEVARTAKITVKAGDKTEEITVTQAAKVENDPAISFPKGTDQEMAELTFLAAAELTKTIDATTNVALKSAAITDAAGAPATAAWITATSVSGKTLTVTVAENAAYTPRESYVTVTNNLDGKATVKIVQGKRDVISGTWTWTSLNAIEDSKEGWAAAATNTGTCTIAQMDGGYVIIGIKGRGQKLADLMTANSWNIDNLVATMFIAEDPTNGNLSAGMGKTEFLVGRTKKYFDLGFATGEGDTAKKYYTARKLYYTHMDASTGAEVADGSGFMMVEGYDKLDFPITLTTEGNAQTLTFLDTYLGNTSIKYKDGENPVFPDLVGQVVPATVGYYYFEALSIGSLANARLSATPLDVHRNLVLTRTVTQ